MTPPGNSRSNNGAVILSARDITKDYIDGTRRLRVLTGVNLEIGAGEFLSIVGQSGSGKSTLLHILGALDRPTSGSVTLDGDDYQRMSERQLAHLRSRRIGFVYQFHHLLPEFTALENVLLPGLIARESPAGNVLKAQKILERVGLGERLDHRPSKLSGGEQQRVAVARALLNEPLVVLADEPTGNLDAQTAREVLDFLVQITVGEGRSLVMVTHDEGIARRADRCFLLREGRLSPKKAT